LTATAANAAAPSKSTPTAAMRKCENPALIVLLNWMFFIMSPFLPLQIAAKKFQEILGFITRKV
jgi:hypothetical protein